ncbi:3194_t:CDS:2 [Scutellospora calospora]|uniref:3194_t:CDS:1 n=1 Tax=Scutellospora calospora TaxID=85575 RepID=A0ACA9KJU4_9GLOM|nr:3194_t:CDS:2 [Scutellospora calospora]
MSLSNSKIPYDTSYNRLKLVLAIKALVILRNKPIDWTIDEYIRFVNWTPKDQKEKKQVNDNIDSNQKVFETKDTHVTVEEQNQINSEVNNDKDSDDDDCQRWKKRALELANEVETLKQRLCIVELELETAKQGASNKRRKTKAQQTTAITESEQGSVVSLNSTNKKQSGKGATAKRGSKKFQDPESKIFQKIPGADDEELNDKSCYIYIEAWKLFDISQAMSFLQQIKQLAHTTLPVIPVTDSSSFSPYSANSGAIITKTIIKIISYMNLKLASLLHVFENNTVNNISMLQAYPLCINSFGSVMIKLLAFFDSPLISKSEKNEIIITLANSFTSLIKAIHTISMRMLCDALQDNESINNRPNVTNVKSQDPRDAIAKLLIHICQHVGPQLKDAVSLAAVKECLRLVSDEFDIVDENPSRSLSCSAVIIPILSTDQDAASLVQDSTFSTKKDTEISDVVRKDSAYFLLWILEEILTKENNETRKTISTLLEKSLAYNKRASLHGDVYTMYLWNICEKIWTLTGSFT